MQTDKELDSKFRRALKEIFARQKPQPINIDVNGYFIKPDDMSESMWFEWCTGYMPEDEQETLRIKLGF
jgi:hypothetical protein